MCAHVLVAEDDVKHAEAIRLYLEREGHSATVVHDGRAAIDQVRRLRPDLIVLDVMMPVVDGLDVCRILRRESDDLPVLMLTARSTEEDLLLGLDLGADDYMTKPYSARELMARIRTLLRRTGQARESAHADDDVLRVGALALDPARHELRVDGRAVECTAAEFRILAVMAEQPGRVFSRSQLLSHLHGFDRYITQRTVDFHVMNLRRKVEPDPRRPVRLMTVFGVGYKLTDGSGGSEGSGDARL